MLEIEKLLICLRIKGFAKVEALAVALGVAPDEVSSALESLIGVGEAEDTRVGARLTPSGKARADAILAGERTHADAIRIAADVERFNPLNLTFKQLMSRWQMREVDGKQVRNDHSDAEYDTQVMKAFADIHVEVETILASITDTVARFGDYSRRFGAAWEKARDGDIRYVAATDLDSYHTIWFELHQDLIGLSGTTRAKEAAAGRAY
jgi:pyruvate,orthophosphate dikinase